MLKPESASILGELEDVLKSGSAEKRVETLRRITSLFLEESDRLSEKQISVFDDVLVHLVQRIEAKAVVELSRALAPVENAPFELVKKLAHAEAPEIAGPILSQSGRLTESDLIQIAGSKGQAHLLAISGRSIISEDLTDILIRRGNGDVFHRLAENAGATFSEYGFDAIVEGAGQDAGLAEKLAFRLDIPFKLLRQLIERASNVARDHIMAAASPELKAQIQRAINGIATAVGREAGAARSFDKAETLVQHLNRQGKLNESALVSFINENRYEDAVATLALFCGSKTELIEKLMKAIRPDGVIVACKAAKLSWQTVSVLLGKRFSHHSISEAELNEAKKSFLTLSQASAQRTLRFMQVHPSEKAS